MESTPYGPLPKTIPSGGFTPDLKAATEILKRRTYQAVKRRSCDLKLMTKKRIIWTAASVSRMRKIYPTGTREEIMAAFPGVSWDAILNIRKRYKIYRIRRPPKGPVPFIIAQIKKRAKARNYTVKELTDATRAGLLFKQPARGSCKRHLAVIYRALEELDGELQIIWRKD